MTACEACKGSCCRFLRLPVPEESFVWLELHGLRVVDGHVELEIPCLELENGRCRSYEVRPQVCQELVVGHPACVYSVCRYGKWEEVKSLMPKWFMDEGEGNPE